MLAEIVGIKNINFTNKEGQEINGKKIYYKFENENVLGFETSELFVPTDKFDDTIILNDKVYIYFNQKGKLELIKKAVKKI